MSALPILFHTSYRWDDLQVVVFAIADCHWRYEGRPHHVATIVHPCQYLFIVQMLPKTSQCYGWHLFWGHPVSNLLYYVNLFFIWFESIKSKLIMSYLIAKWEYFICIMTRTSYILMRWCLLCTRPQCLPVGFL